MKEQQKNILSQNERTINSRKDIVMENKVDLHVHTTKSDGTRTPKQVLMEAEQLGLHIIAITDHESVQAYPEIKENRHLFSGIIVPGIELKTICQNREIVLLGYGISIDEMEKNLPSIYKTKEDINRGYVKAIVRVLRKNGIILPDDVEERYGEKDITGTQPAWFIRKVMAEESKENQEYNMKVLYSEDIIEHGEKDGFYRHWLSNPESKFYVEYNVYPDYKQAINLIQKSGGKVFIPHIYQYRESSEDILEELLETGDIDGIECYYPTFTPEQTEHLLEICNKYNLFVSGGSDYHGTNKIHQLGTGIDNNLFVPEEKVVTWTDTLSFK